MIWILEIVPVYHIKNSGNTGVEISYFKFYFFTFNVIALANLLP
jgi:hypothetical protein